MLGLAAKIMQSDQSVQHPDKFWYSIDTAKNVSVSPIRTYDELFMAGTEKCNVVECGRQAASGSRFCTGRVSCYLCLR